MHNRSDIYSGDEVEVMVVKKEYVTYIRIHIKRIGKDKKKSN